MSRLVLNKQMQCVEAYDRGRRTAGYTLELLETVDRQLLHSARMAHYLEVLDWYDRFKQRLSWRTK